MIDVGTVIGDRYEVEKHIASGGMGTVLLVRHHTLHSLHAMKILHVSGRQLRERLLTEGRVQASLKHPNIVAVTDTLTIDGAPAIVMEYVDGGSLEDRLYNGVPMSLDEAESLFMDVAAGVFYAHQKGLVHRDLKPANVLLTPPETGGVAKVTDFGIVKVLEDLGGTGGNYKTRTGVAMGTPQYMSPEQAEGAGEVGPEADVFSLGCILYEMVCGRRPFEGTGVLAIFSAAAEGMFDDPADLRPGLPDRVVHAIRGALVPEREHRIQRVDELVAVLTDGNVPRLFQVSAQPAAPRVSSPASGYPRGIGSIDKHRSSRAQRSQERPAAGLPTTASALFPPNEASAKRATEPPAEPPAATGGRGLILGAVGLLGGLGAAIVVLLLVVVVVVVVGVAASVLYAQPVDQPVDTGPIVDVDTGTLAAGTDVVDVGSGVVTPPDVVDPGSDIVTPPDVVDPPGTDVVEPGTDVVELGTDVVEPGTDVVEPGTDVVEPGTDVLTHVVEPHDVVKPPDVVEPAEAEFSVRVLSRRFVKETKRGVIPYRASGTDNLLLIVVQVSNRSQHGVDTIAPWRLKAGGTTYEGSTRCNLAVMGGITNAVDVSRGNNVKGTVCFEVPRKVTGGDLIFAPGTEGFDPVVVRF